MSWNYRVMRRVDEDGEQSFGIHEVYYNDAGEVVTWSVEPEPVMDLSLGGLRAVLKLMRRALRQPVLDHSMKPQGRFER